MLAFATYQDQTGLHSLNVPWFQDADRVWDIQDMPFTRLIEMARQKPGKIGVADMVEWLGINVGQDMLHNAGNDAAFELEGMLAGLLLSADQRHQLRESLPLPLLPSTWREASVQRNKISKPPK